MRKYGKWVLTLGLLTATPGLTLAAGLKSKADDKPAAESKSSKEENQKVANEIAKAMRSKKISGDISIEYKNGVATLSGSVADPKIRDKAQEAVSKVKGVSRVDNRLAVAKAAAAQPVATANAQTAPPASARAAVAAKPAAPPARQVIEQASATTASAGGVVSANHTASSAKANRVQQVNAEVAPPSANQEVAEQIGAALTAASLDGYAIDIRYQNGVATLDGSVGTQAERERATQVVQQIPSVRSVANRLSCAREQAPPPAYGQAPPGYGQAPPGYGQAPQGYPQAPQGYPQAGQPGMYPVGYRQGGAAMPPAPGGAVPQGAAPMAPPMPPMYGHPGAGASQAVYNQPNCPEYAWPSYAQYPNVAAVNYPTQYSASAWPYIGPFYPYPQVPLGWRDATLRWDDGQWNLMFRTRTDKWWWYLNPNNW